MTRQDFQRFVEDTIRAVVELAEDKLDRVLTLSPYLRWYPSPELVKESIAESVTSRVYIDAEHICPCVDFGVGEVLEDGRPVIFAIISGHPPTTFGKNWTGREGPFVYIHPSSGQSQGEQ